MYGIQLNWQRNHLQCRRLQFDFWIGKFPWRRDRLPTPVFMGFPGGSDGKEPACNTGDLCLIPGLGRSPGGGHGYPLQDSCLENPHGQRSLVGYSPWGRKESDTTEGFYFFLCVLDNVLDPGDIRIDTTAIMSMISEK